MSEPKVGKNRLATEFWDRLELNLKIGEKEIQFKGWQAPLMCEFIMYKAAMTRDGALEFVLAGGKAYADPKKVGCFIDEMFDDGLLKYHYEKRKTGKRMRIYMSKLYPSQFKCQRIVHEEEE